MPLPKPKNREKKSEFVSRCVAELDKKGEFPDNKQKVAVCYSRFEESKAEASVVAQFGGEEMLFFYDEEVKSESTDQNS